MSKKNITILIIVFVILFIALLAQSNNNVTYTSISVEEMYEMNENGVIIDVRTYEEYIAYNIDDSINIPLDEIDSVLDIITEKETQIFVYCASGIRSNEAAEMLIDLGYTNVYDMGGIYN